jgi:hypothetical protein
LFRRILIWSGLTLKTLCWNIPDNPLTVIICRNFDPLRCDSKHRRLDGVYVIPTWNPFPPDGFPGTSAKISHMFHIFSNSPTKPTGQMGMQGFVPIAPRWAVTQPWQCPQRAALRVFPDAASRAGPPGPP